MPSARLATAATIAGLAVALLAGCSSTHATAAHTTAPKATSSAASKTANHEPQTVSVEKIVDQTTVVVRVADKDDAENGQRFTVHLDDIVAPTKDACGYDESLAKAKSLLEVDHSWLLRYPNNGSLFAIEANGDRNAYFDSLGETYGEQMLAAGMATASDYATWDQNFAGTAQEAKTGLWGTCTDFGA